MSEGIAECTRPEIWAEISPLQPSQAFLSYWNLASQRQLIYFARLVESPPPWTADPILRQFRFTNAYRAADRVSQFLIRKVIYQEKHVLSPEDVVFRVLLFKMFNKIATWNLLEREVGPILLSTFRFDTYDDVLSRAFREGRTIYSNAYIMPPAGSFGHPRKHSNHLRLLELMMRKKICRDLGQARDMRAAFDLLRSYPTVGNFLAYQLVTDINYSEITNFSENSFVAAGPGAKSGIRKVFALSHRMSDSDIIRLMVDIQDEALIDLGIDFQDLFGRRLRLIDCQNLFCEVDKYSRVAHPELSRGRGRRRIKQRFVQSGSIPRPMFPPKWGLEGAIARRLAEWRTAHGNECISNACSAN